MSSYVVEVVARNVDEESREAINLLLSNIPHSVRFGSEEEPRILIPVNAHSISEAEKFVRKNLDIPGLDIKRYALYNSNNSSISIFTQEKDDNNE